MASSMTNLPTSDAEYIDEEIGVTDFHPHRDWLNKLYVYFMLTFAALIGGVSVIVFLVPANIAPGGISGISIILNGLIGTPVGTMMLLLNIPIMIIGYRMLGGWAVIARTIYFVTLYSVFVDVLTPFFPAEGVSDNVLLNAIFSGVVGGISGGIVLRMNATGGGTATLGRVLQMKFGIPISSASLYTDGLVILLAGLVFGWEAAMYAIISIIAYGTVTDYVLEGPSVIRTATIITNNPRELSDAIMSTMRRGVTSWDGHGMYTNQPHTVLFVTILRTQVSVLKDVVAQVDPEAFVVIGHGHVAYGQGFRHFPKNGAPKQPAKKDSDMPT